MAQGQTWRYGKSRGKQYEHGQRAAVVILRPLLHTQGQRAARVATVRRPQGQRR